MISHTKLGVIYRVVVNTSLIIDWLFTSICYIDSCKFTVLLIFVEINRSSITISKFVDEVVVSAALYIICKPTAGHGQIWTQAEWRQRSETVVLFSSVESGNEMSNERVYWLHWGEMFCEVFCCFVAIFGTACQNYWEPNHVYWF